MRQRSVPQSFNDYKRRTGANPYLYSFNVAAQDGALQFPESKVFCLAGWSDAVFTTMANLERDPMSLIAEIEATNF